MRILHVVPTYLPAIRYGGPIWSVHGLASAQAVANDVHVYTTNLDGAGFSEVPVNVPVRRDGVAITYFETNFGRRLSYAPAMAAALAANIASFDIVNIHGMFLWPGIAASRLARKAGTPYIVSPRGMLVRELMAQRGSLRKKLWLGLFDRKMLGGAAFIHVTSVEEDKSIRDLDLALAPLAIVPNGADLPGPRGDAALSADVRRIVDSGFELLAFGRINWKKGLDRLIAALPQAPGLRAVIAGNDEDEYTRRLLQLAREEKVGDRVTFLPRQISGADKEALFRAAKIAVLLSASENFGNVVLEAMIRGVPVVVGSGVGAADAVKASGGGFVTDTAPRPLGEILARLAAEPDLRRQMGDAGRDYARRHFAWSEIADQMMKLYETARQRHAELHAPSRPG